MNISQKLNLTPILKGEWKYGRMITSEVGGDCIRYGNELPIIPTNNRIFLV
jgi:hypothetical protein